MKIFCKCTFLLYNAYVQILQKCLQFNTVFSVGDRWHNKNYPNPAKSPVGHTAAPRPAVTAVLQATGLDSLVPFMSSQGQGQALIVVPGYPRCPVLSLKDLLTATPMRCFPFHTFISKSQDALCLFSPPHGVVVGDNPGLAKTDTQ